jgi:alkanesulfonate monooxygenase SsuD/methylene tetrahydromethanopterin reductase-like flavin-dependent oxidoreductase (luciferase family)
MDFALEESMESGGSGKRILQAMEAAEPGEASAAMGELIQRLQGQGSNGLDLSGLRGAFKRLLRRRGYFVGSPAEMAAALEEIAAVGEGFDLYDLARSLAQYDTIRTQCLRLTPRRALPELRRFSPACSCEKHRKER